MYSLTLIKTEKEHLPYLFRFQTDADAIQMAAFTPKDPFDKAAYLTKWENLLQNPEIHNQTIMIQGEIVGSVAKYVMDNQAEITYWIDKKYWGQGIATAALTAFLQLEPTRPLFARAAFDNIGSQRVLQKCGFVNIGIDKGFANARNCEISEYIFQLEGGHL